LSRFAFLLLPVFLFGLDFRVATYNLENLFDAKKEGNEYKEYTPGTKHGWNEVMMQHKITNLARVIKDMDADIIALMEVENKEVLLKLNHALEDKRYAYVFYPQKKPRVSIETALLSRFPIDKTSTISLKDQARGIHKVSLLVDKYPLDVYINHWPAMPEREDERMEYAQTLRRALMTSANKESIVLGDFNSPLEIQKNDWGRAFGSLFYHGDAKMPLSNLWYELAPQKRYSHVYGKKRSALDHMIISNTLDDSKAIEYTKGSFTPFSQAYMLESDGSPKRWQISEKGRGNHIGIGFSDHLPLTATFHTLSH
jgi:endonuclease/exonuclease/phosphatase family metal-dependent hydrolase